MDEGNERKRFVSRRPDENRSSPSQRSSNSGNLSNGRQNGNNGNAGERGGGLLSRYGNSGPLRQDERGQPPEQDERPAQPPRLSMPAKEQNQHQGERRGALHSFGGQARRLGDNFRRAIERNRKPAAGNWRASDFEPEVLEDWDRNDSAPFALPEDPFASSDDDAYGYEDSRNSSRGNGRGTARAADDFDDRYYDDTYDAPPARKNRSNQRQNNRARNAWDDDEYADASWETGTWDTGWATDFQPEVSNDALNWEDESDYGTRGSYGSYGNSAGYGNSGNYGRYNREAEQSWGMTSATGTMAQLSNVRRPIRRVERVRLLLRRRPTAAALLAFLLVGMLLTCCAPLVPVLRLGTDAADAYRRVQALQSLFAGGTSALLNSAKLQEAQGQLDGLSQDLAEINSVVNVVGAPLGVVSPQLRDYRLLSRMGADLVAAADEGLQVGQTILTPLEGGALSASDSSPGITQANINQAQQVVNDASLRVADALAAYAQLNKAALPSQLRPGSKLGKYLALLPLAPQVLGELQTLLGSMPALLGIGQPANYLVLALDRSEVRPIGGFAGNYGVLTLVGGRQSKTYPLALSDIYQLDQNYYNHYVTDHSFPACKYGGPQPPEYYWWWPIRYDGGCKFAWGLRDMGLAAGFPANAQTAMQIAEDTPHAIPNDGQLRGVIAFTPVLIEQLLQLTGNISLPQWTKDPITPKNLEYLIHQAQLGHLQHAGVDRKTFTHDLSAVMLTKLKSLHGAQLKAVFDVAAKALKSKDLQLYFADPHAELILQQLGLASTVRTGNGDGFYVVDTNDGGDKANAFVTEQQTDVVTLLPNGGALHHLRIAVTYDRKGLVFSPNTDDYNDMQRIYLPGDATVLGYSGFNPLAFNQIGPQICNGLVSTALTDCSSDNFIHEFTNPVTESDVPGRTMVMGALTINCGSDPGLYASGSPTDSYECQHGPTPHTQTIYVTYYTPHALTLDSSGHGTYSEVVEEQPGSGDFIFNVGNYLTVYVDTSQLHSSHPQTNTNSISDDPTFQQLIGKLKPISGFNHTQLDSDLTVSVSF